MKMFSKLQNLLKIIIGKVYKISSRVIKSLRQAIVIVGLLDQELAWGVCELRVVIIFYLWKKIIFPCKSVLAVLLIYFEEGSKGKLKLKRNYASFVVENEMKSDKAAAWKQTRPDKCFEIGWNVFVTREKFACHTDWLKKWRNGFSQRKTQTENLSMYEIILISALNHF